MVRTDLKMGRGKIAVQAAHAAILASEEAKRHNPSWHRGWMEIGMAKIAVRVPTLEDLKAIERAARAKGLPVAVVEDRGLTQVQPGTVTCIAIGPAPTSQIDSITGHLKLL